MISKKELIQGLKRVKLVLGNGFDLHCHLKTSYADYFLYDERKNQILNLWVNQFSEQAKNYVSQTIPNHQDFWINLEGFDWFNVWDIYFFLISRNERESIKKWQWCDIESKIQDSLKDLCDAPQLCWARVYQLLTDGPNHQAVANSLFVLTAFVHKKRGGEGFSSINRFYSFLLEQLKEFEQKFGRYIYRQHYDDSSAAFNVIVPNHLFKGFSKRTINDLCNINNLVSVESFNFDSPELDEIAPIFHNINGTVGAPIFGIDSDAFQAPDERYAFSKTIRRMELDMLNNEARDRTPFDNIIVFGHSLNRADYSYFFALLDRLDITNLEKDARIVFAFSIYKKSREEEIRAEQRKAIFQLFQDYSIYKGDKTSPNRLLDSLTTQGKVLMFEIPYIDVTPEPGYFRQ